MIHFLYCGSAYAIYKINIRKIKKIKNWWRIEQILFIVYKHSGYFFVGCSSFFVLYIFLPLFDLDEEGWGRDPPGHNIGDGKTPQKSDWE